MENKYSYSPKDVEEAKAIRSEFIPVEKKEIDKLRTIKRNAEGRARVPAITLGVIAAIIFGIGFSLTLFLPSYFILGIAVGIIGIVGIAFAYPLYKSRLSKEKERVEDDVVALADAIING